MLLKLSGRGLRLISQASTRSFVGRLVEQPLPPSADRSNAILRIRGSAATLPEGFRAYLLDEGDRAPPTFSDVFVLGDDLRYVAEGDVVRIDPSRRAMAVLYRRNSPSNSFLVTERCDNRCLMCSQPPRDQDDSWLIDELLEVIPLVSRGTREIGITGGEPGLLGDRLIELTSAMGQHLPHTAIHVLSNGRAFAHASFANRLAQVGHLDLMIGIPLYSDLAEEHDYVVQAPGAFEDTIAGILNLKHSGIRVELRFVIHAQTYQRLSAFARFVARNLCFVDHVALMGLELVGYAKTNLSSLWIDPVDYQDELTSAVLALQRAGLATSIYNHPLCLLPPVLHSAARRSISDWKNRYFSECDSCARMAECCGFFASAVVRRSRGIKPFAVVHP